MCVSAKRNKTEKKEPEEQQNWSSDYIITDFAVLCFCVLLAATNPHSKSHRKENKQIVFFFLLFMRSYADIISYYLLL